MDRFWSRVNRDDGNGCWLWQGVVRPDGYGQLMVRGKLTRAHRLSWELTNGPIPHGKSVLHRCDNPPCVRPDHLFIGTQSDNIHDMMSKGRERMGHGRHLTGPTHHWHGQDQAGEANHAARLTPERVRRIRAKGDAGYTAKELAAEFGVHEATIGCVLRRETWQGIEPDVSLEPVSRVRYTPKLSPAIADEIRSVYTGARGELTYLAAVYGVSRPTIRAILDGRSYRHT